MSKPKPPDPRPLDVILEERFRDWLTNGVPYESDEFMKWAVKTNPDGTPKRKVYIRRRPPTTDELKMIVAFLNRQAKARSGETQKRVPISDRNAPKSLLDAANERFKIRKAE